MNNEIGQIRDRQIEQVRALAEPYDIGTCEQCAAAIKAYLKEQQVKGRHIKLQTLSPDGLMGIIYDDGTNQQIATNGYHEGIVIEIAGAEKVFDNLYPQGKQIDIWRQDLVVIPGNQLNLVKNDQF